jgi:hypothetical protein
MSMSIPTPARPASTPLRERVNLRLIGFVAIFAVIFGWIIFLSLDSVISGGRKNHGDYWSVDLKAMSDFKFSQTDGTVDDVPKQWRELNGQTVLLEGEMAPTGQTSNGVGRQFELVYSVAKCCFGGPPQIQHFVKVTVPPDAEVNVQHSGVLRVKGKLKVDVTRDPETGAINGVYHVLAEGVHSV